MTDTHNGTHSAWPGHLRRVAILSHSSTLYGAGRSLLELVRSLRSMGMEVGVVLPRAGMLDRKLRQYQCKIWYVQLPVWVRSSTVESALLPAESDFSDAAGNVVREIKSWNADLLWTNSSVTPVGALAAKSLSIPHIWHLRELNGKGYGYEFSVGEFAAVELLRTASCRIAVSRTVKALYENLGCGHCDWVYNGIGPVARLEKRSSKLWSHDALRLVIVGQVMKAKGQSIAIEAIHKLRSAGYPVFLRVVGGGDVDSCCELVNRLGARDWVEFFGFCEHVDEHYRWADIALSCASIEAMGRSTVEAMSWGLPVAGHCGAGTGELVTASEGGLLYDGSADHLTQVIITLIKDPASASSMGEAGQLWARTHVSSERHASQIREIVGAIPCLRS